MEQLSWSSRIANAAADLARRRPLLVSAALVATVLGVTLCAFHPRYETNDDAMMNLVAAGRLFTDTPDEHLLYTNVLLGLVLKQLYQAVPTFPWYGVYLLGLTLLALVGVSHALLRCNPTARQLLLTVLFLLAAGLPCLVWLQFTKTAALSALAGLFLLLAASETPGSWYAWPAGLLLLLAGFLVRFDAGLLACLLLAPALVARLVRPVNGRRALAAWLGVALVLAWTGQHVNRWYYEADQRWRGFYEFNELRAQFNDYKRVVDSTEDTRPILASVGWSKTDLAMLFFWAFLDEERFSTEKLRTVLQEAGLHNRMPRDWARVGPDLLLDGDLPALLGCLPLALVLIQGRRRWVVPLVCLGVALGAAALLYELYQLPRRVAFPTFAAVLAVAIFWSRAPSLGAALPRPAAWRWVSLSLAVGTALLLTWQLARAALASSYLYRQHLALETMLDRLRPRPSQLFVLCRALLPLEGLVYPLERLNVSPDFKAIGFLTLTRTPFTQERLTQFGITDLFRAMHQRQDVIFLSDELYNRVLGAYLAEHYGVRLGGRVVFRDRALKGASCYTFIDLNRRRGTAPLPGGKGHAAAPSRHKPTSEGFHP